MDRYVHLPPLPQRISRLNELAYDLWWSWNHGAREVFRSLDYPLWRFTDHNPVLLLHLIQPERLEFAATDHEFLGLYDKAVAALDAIRSGTGTWWDRHGADGGPIAWVTPQFALHQSLPVHATSEGVVSGDAAKQASDLGLPFVGVGLMYAHRYPHQRFGAEGWQQESIEHLDWSDAPPSPEESVSFAALDRQLTSRWRALAPHRKAVLALAQHDSDRGAAFHGAVLSARRSSTVKVAEEGVHLASWVSADLAALIEAHVGPGWLQQDGDRSSWRALLNVPDDEIWAVRQRLRRYLVAFMRERARRRWAREQASGSRLVALGTLLDDTTLTIGCTPRFSEGGADCVFTDVDRLAGIATAARRPVQFVFAGRVNAGDDAGKHRLQRAFRQTLDPAFGGRLAFLEGYDLHVARLMVQGCDLWLTLPPRPGAPSLGAMKAAVNGVLHAGPAPFSAAGAATADWTADDARTLYSLIEERIVPAFYERDRSQVPDQWTARVRETLADALPRFTARPTLTNRSGTVAQ